MLPVRLILLFLAFALSACTAMSVAPVPVSPDVDEIEQMLARLYQTFSFEPGTEADWDGMRELFAEGASFAAPIRSDQAVKLTDTEAFIADFARWIRTSEVGRTGLHERILSTRIDVFGNIAHAYVTFEGIVPGEEQRQSLGLDSLQLVLDRGQWKLASFTSQYTSAALPLPGRFNSHATPSSGA
ncbi:MAG: hypothetical protein ACI8X5_002932 [Planctomycetota bacterium]